MTIARIGTTFRVNIYTSSAQNASDLAALQDGSFVVVWRDNSVSGSDTSLSAVRARIFNADGSQSVVDFVVPTTMLSDQFEPSVTTLADGRFVVSWTDLSLSGGDTDGPAIRARIFNADGSQSVPEFLVNTSTYANQVESSVIALSDGRFMVTWQDTGAVSGDTSESAIRARIFNADGTQSVAEFVVNTSTNFSQILGVATELADGRILVSWTDYSLSGGDTSFAAIRARILNPDGTESVAEFVVNATTANPQTYSTVAALGDGRFVIAWTDFSVSGGDTSGSAIRARIFNPDGSVSVAEFVVNTTTANDQFAPAVAALADGRFIVTWSDLSLTGGDSESGSVRARIFNADGTQSVPEFLVNTIVTGDQQSSRVTVLADGRIAISWTDSSQAFGDTSGSAVVAQIFDATLYDGTSAGDLANGGSFDDRYTGYSGNDTLSGRGGDDRLFGGEGEDSLSGDAGDDTLDGGNGGDNAFGGAGTDYIYGRSGNELLYGGTEGDHLWGGTGGDAHSGGDGIDYARYDDANHGNLVIRLDNPALNTGAAAGDTYVGIEGLVGGAGNDLVVGDGQNNFLFGSGGADQVYGGVGNDYLSGDAGGDNLWGGVGADAHYGGNDGVDYARYDDANHGNLTLRLDNAAANAGAAAVGDTYTGIEGLVGGAGADVIIGNSAANWLFGSGGADYIDGLAGYDYLNGGAGADRFRFSTALSGTNVDQIADFQHLVDDILLVPSVFAGIGPTLTADEFRIGMAQDANDRILYNNGTGQLYYDSNANVAGGMILFATVTAGTVLTFDDFVMV